MKRTDTKTVEELLGDTDEVTTELLVELAHGNRADTEYQDDLRLLENLPVVLRLRGEGVNQGVTQLIPC